LIHTQISGIDLVDRLHLPEDHTAWPQRCQLRPLAQVLPGAAAQGQLALIHQDVYLDGGFSKWENLAEMGKLWEN
jgi:hypothetical protein